MPKGKGQKRLNINFRETHSERSATNSFRAFREQFVKMLKKVKGTKHYES